jgi:hypothetical protein
MRAKEWYTKMFKITCINGAGNLEKRFEEIGVTDVESFTLYIEGIDETHRLISSFKNFLLANGQYSRSNISESEYIHYNGCCFRFSGHVYPTGSMTQLAGEGEGWMGYKKVDFAADPKLIYKFQFK